MANILDEIVAHKREELARAKQERPLERLQEQLAAMTDIRDRPRNFYFSLRGRQVRVIAEIKRCSPSEGQIAQHTIFDPRSIAQDYGGNGAAAISVLTDEKYFGGDLLFLRRARSMMPLPALRKDFIVDPYQVYEARLFKADAVLLIAAILDTSQLRKLLRLAHELKMGALVEVHDAWELDRALDLDAPAIGINNRDLATMTVNLDTSARLAPQVPRRHIVVSESGIHDQDDVRRLADAGVDAVLVGTALMKSEDPGRALLPLTRVEAKLGIRPEH